MHMETKVTFSTDILCSWQDCSARWQNLAAVEFLGRRELENSEEIQQNLEIFAKLLSCSHY